MTNTKISDFVTATYSASLIVPVVDTSQPSGQQNRKILASDLKGAKGDTGAAGADGVDGVDGAGGAVTLAAKSIAGNATTAPAAAASLTVAQTLGLLGLSAATLGNSVLVATDAVGDAIGLTLGDGLSIAGGALNAAGTTYTAGTGVTITGAEIALTLDGNGQIAPSLVPVDGSTITVVGGKLVADTIPAYTAGTGVTIAGTEIALTLDGNGQVSPSLIPVDGDSISVVGGKVVADIPAYTAGTGVTITGAEIALTLDGNGQTDPNLIPVDGTSIMVTDGVLVADTGLASLHGLDTANTLADSDTVAMVLGGADRRVTLANLKHALAGVPAGTLTIGTVADVMAGVGFTVAGTWDAVRPGNLEYSLDSGAVWADLPGSYSIGLGSTWSFDLAIGSVAAAQTVMVRDYGAIGTTATSNSFAVTTPASSITVTTPAEQSKGDAFTLSGTYTLTQPAALDYSLDGTAWIAAVTPTIGMMTGNAGPWSFSLTIAAANAAQTITVRDHAVPAVAGESGTFAVIDLSQPPALTGSGTGGNGPVPLVAHYDASAGATLFADAARTTPAVANGPVQGVADTSGTNKHLARAVQANAPVLKTGVLNGKPGLLFNDQSLESAVNEYWPQAGDSGLTILAVYKGTGGATQGNLVSTSSNFNSATKRIELFTGNPGGAGFHVASATEIVDVLDDATAAGSNTGPSYAIGRYNLATGAVSVKTHDGTDTGTMTPAAVFVYSGVILGKNDPGVANSAAFFGHMFEIVMWRGCASDDEITALIAWIQAKWGPI